jgi:hypothetical protein
MNPLERLKADLTLAELCYRVYAYHDGSVGELEYLVTWVGSRKTIAIRGTEAGKMFSGGGWVDVVRDLRILPWFITGAGWVHAGMGKGARRLKRELEGHSLISRTDSLLITGHSLGAGVGMVLAELFASDGYDVEFVGFGTPRAMLQAPKVPGRYYRNGQDPVTEVPRPWMFGYSALPVTNIGMPSGQPARDHFLSNYIESLHCALEVGD